MEKRKEDSMKREEKETKRNNNENSAKRHSYDQKSFFVEIRTEMVRNSCPPKNSLVFSFPLACFELNDPS